MVVTFLFSVFMFCRMLNPMKLIWFPDAFWFGSEMALTFWFHFKLRNSWRYIELQQFYVYTRKKRKFCLPFQSSWLFIMKSGWEDGVPEFEKTESCNLQSKLKFTSWKVFINWLECTVKIMVPCFIKQIGGFFLNECVGPLCLRFFLSWIMTPA